MYRRFLLHRLVLLSEPVTILVDDHVYRHVMLVVEGSAPAKVGFLAGSMSLAPSNVRGVDTLCVGRENMGQRGNPMVASSKTSDV